VGPLNLTIQQGEILFIVGGNGSGKSTLLKLLTGLYYPDVGTLSVDDKVIEQDNYQAYRELFSIIFTDFHLFDRLYGLPAVDEQQLNALLRLMELEKKTQYLDGKFSHLDLSTGQKKRLAFIVTVLEDKPVYILDELAADQDPQFRKYFYEKVLPDLREQGKTIIAVTHDDKYFEVADRIIKMDYGEINDE
jgi:putative ATP-binding cassette transporter